MLCLSTLGRAGVQITLSELAASVSADAGRIPGLGLDPDEGGDRRAFVDAVGWLERRGALTLADGSASSWASNPGAGEALYDVARDVLFALYRPTRMVQAIPTVGALLDQRQAGSGNEEWRLAAQAARRAVVERPVVYFHDVPEWVGNHLRAAALAEDLRRLTGLRVERRAEGVLLVDTANFSADRFPGTSSPAQAAILLAVEMADRIIDPDGRRLRRMVGPSHASRQEELIARIDAGLPTATMALFPVEGALAELDDTTSDGEDDSDDTGNSTDGRHPFIPDSFLRTATERILSRHSSAFGADWHGDSERLRTEAIDVLARFGCVQPVPGGVLVLALTGRYRNTMAIAKARKASAELL
jgi:hypothetical protein